ncbi:MAG: hypothetical protein NVSMB9_30320 [Isosphaeraceae bacterium]
MSLLEKRRTSFFVFLSLAFVCAGCGGGSADRPRLGKVSGKVTYKGEPVTTGSVIFTPTVKDSGGHVATGQIESDGSYSLTTFDTGDGAVLGQHIVTVEARAEMTSPPMDKEGRITYTPPKMMVPEKYTNPQKTPFRYTVEASGNTINLELKD